MSTAKAILQNIRDRKFSPMYLLYGEEPYFVDQISDAIEGSVLNEDECGFNQTILYGRDIEVEDISAAAKRYPMMAEYQVIVVKEAQALSRQIDKLASYTENPQPTTILVLKWMGKKPDMRKKVFKNIKKNGITFESKRLYENKMLPWMQERAKAKSLTLQPRAGMMLTEFLGTDLGKVENELTKLALVLGHGGEITPAAVEENIGISKDFNNFELRKAVGERNTRKVFQIVQYFEQNPKEHPLMLTVSQLFGYFQSLLRLHALKDKSKTNIARELSVNPYFVPEYTTAARNYNMKSCAKIVSFIREADLKSKGLGGGNMPQGDILKELMSKILLR